MIPDAGFHGNDMSTSSEARRRAQAALVHALDANPDVSNPATRAAIRAFVEALVSEGLLPEATVIAFKATLSLSESLHRIESEEREQLRASLVSTCIERYFEVRGTDDTRPASPPTLRLVRDREASPSGPEATT
ncbi:MAG TPA: hypothetical protein VKA54_22785 [Gemmatimonadaceae bacterium]|nr:hypothetical protein [Gemmatimonadaceae bacterium]